MVVSYIVRPENSGQEKCAVWGCANVLMDETPEQVIREMVATAEAIAGNCRSRNGTVRRPPWTKGTQKIMQTTLARMEVIRRKAILTPPPVRLPAPTVQTPVPAPLPLPMIAAADMRHFALAVTSARLKRNMGMIADKFNKAREQVRHISRPVTLDSPVFSVQQWGRLEFPAISQAALRRLFQQQATRWAQGNMMALRQPLTTIASQVSALPEPHANTGDAPKEDNGMHAG